MVQITMAARIKMTTSTPIRGHKLAQTLSLLLLLEAVALDPPVDPDHPILNQLDGRYAKIKIVVNKE